MDSHPISPPLLPRDREHLNLLSVFHFVFGGLAIIGILFLLAHYIFFQAILSAVSKDPSFTGGPPMEIFSHMVWFYVIMGLALLTAGALNVYAGICLRRCTNRVFTLVVAALNCLSIPLGTALGVFTIIVLQRESVMRLYHRE